MEGGKGVKIFSREWIRQAGRRWWFLLLLGLPQLIPPYAAQGYAIHEWPMVNAFILTHPIKGPLAAFYPVFQVIPLCLLFAVLFAGKRTARLFSAYVALTYALVAFLQSISVSAEYGFAVCIANVLTFLALAGLWFWEALFPQNDFGPVKIPVWKYGVVLLALVPFWWPVNPLTLLPDFNPLYLWTSGSGLSFCLVTPLYMSMLVLHEPRVNKIVFTATAFVGFFIGIGNMVLEFVIYPHYWWIGVLHVPLLLISMYGLWLAIHRVGPESE